MGRADVETASVHADEVAALLCDFLNIFRETAEGRNGAVEFGAESLPLLLLGCRGGVGSDDGAELNITCTIGQSISMFREVRYFSPVL